MKKPHIAFVVHDFNPNFGQGRYCYELVQELRDQADFTILANTYVAPKDTDAATWLRIPTLRYNALTTVLSFIPTSEWAVRKLKPDIIHAQGLTCWSADIITGHICNGQRRNRPNTRWVTPRLFSEIMAPLERAFYRQRRASHLIAISKVLADDIETAYGWKKPVSVIYHGTNAHMFQPVPSHERKKELQASFGVPKDCWLWLFMGEAVKGLNQAIHQLRNFPDAHLLVVSRSDFAYFKALAKSEGVTNQITFFGFHPCPEEAFQCADLFLYASDYDPFGMVITEAMASGLPVVVGRNLGASELIRHRVHGLLVDPHNPEDIRSHLSWLRENPEQGRLMGLEGRKEISQYSWKRCAKQTWEVYETVLRQRRHGESVRDLSTPS